MEYQVCLIYYHDGIGSQLIHVLTGDMWDALDYIESELWDWYDGGTITVIET